MEGSDDDMEEDETPVETKQKKGTGPVFNNMTFAITGDVDRKSLTDIITKNGGKVANVVSDKVLLI